MDFLNRRGRRGFLLFLLMMASCYGVDPDPYRMQVGDRLEASLYGIEESEEELIVDPRGRLSFQFIDGYPVAGKTIEEVKAELTQELTSYYRYPIPMVKPIDLHQPHYTIMGEVLLPARNPIRGKATALTAICEAGGFKTRNFRQRLVDTVDLDHSFLARKGEYVPIDFKRLVQEGDLAQDVPLEDGDYLYFKSAINHQVYVVGEVSSPVTIDYYTTMSLAEAIAEAGGVRERASSRVAVIRGSLAWPTRYLIDFNRIVKGYAPDFMLQPGDIVYVPPMKLSRLKEMMKYGVLAFVRATMIELGIEAFLEFHPHAQLDDRAGRVFGG